MKNVAVYLGLALLAAACASNKPTEAPVTDRSSGVTPPSSSTGTGTTTTPAANADVTGNPLHDPNNILSKRSVYFDFDSNVVKDEYRGLIQAHARYMTEHGDARARIEGNCDERGSREYNLALGQRRAEAVKKIMTVLGVTDGRIETISYGEEKPAAPGHDEASWAKNRRDDIKYAGE
jgi:peptidoglycan-associated lipoprotein